MKDRKKKEIREIALELFRQETYEKVSVNQIAKAAGISKNTFYYYFASKEELILDLFQPELLFSDDLMIRLSELSDAGEQIRVMNQFLIRYFVHIGKPVIKVSLLANLARDLTGAEYPSHREMPAFVQVTMNVYKRAIEEGRIRTDLDPLELMKLNGVALSGCLQLWATAPHDFDLEKFYMKNVEYILQKQ